ncbi:hypothetical protein [Xenorhabdus nematophila]|uniref:hypothetical protein n=1 Tax=Xenorhabdus nematophila TaxID=628 RepID=UPI000ADFAA82|nr:hypothetical protein [Xenorhabdus nematophila]
MSHHCDILIMGAGVAGIGMACHLKRECPDKQMIILERRQALEVLGIYFVIRAFVLIRI